MVWFALSVAVLALFVLALAAPRRRGRSAPGPAARRATPGGPSCRWRKEGARSGVTADRWLCLDCGVDAFTTDGKPPKECKQALRPKAL